MTITDCYGRVSRLIGDPDTLEVVRAVEGYREFWKPDKVRVVLLAESHVHTSNNDFERLWSYEGPPVLEGRFVRFVYCLAYGERLLASLPRNRGTWQFWKIFYSCLNRVSGNSDFAPILRGWTPNFENRMRNKIRLLGDLKREGVWLIDASIIAINGLDQSLKDKVTRICWKGHVGPMLETLDPRPERVLVIGSGVARTLNVEISELGFASKVIPQPQARDKSGYLRHFQTCFDFCHVAQV
jgi:hypothetical protein